MAVESIIAGVMNYLRVLRDNGIPVHFGVVYGSHARGNPDFWSDIDVIVVSPRFDGVYSRKDIDRLWRLAARTDSRIEPVPCGVNQWEEDGSSALLEIARREGERVDLGG